MTRWPLDERNPYESAFGQTMIEAIYGPGVDDAFMALVHRVEGDPFAGEPLRVGNAPLYIARTPPISTASGEVPGLTLIYSINDEAKAIRLLCLSRRVDKHASPDQEIESLRPKLQKILDSPKPYPPWAKKPEILSPLEPGSIDEKEIDDAIRRVIARRRAS